MSLNGISLGTAKGDGGILNPPSHSVISNPLAKNLVDDPTIEEQAAGAGPNFQGRIQPSKNFKNSVSAVDVIEGRPDIIETTHIDPLRENASERDQWEDVGITSTGTGSSLNSGMMKAAIDVNNATSNVLTGAMKMAYGSVAGNEEAFKAGKEAVYGKGA